MNYVEFMSAITDIYGKYNSDILKKITVQYVMKRWKEPELESVMEKLLSVKSAKYKTPPDPAEFEEIFPQLNLESEASRWFDTLTRTGNSLDHVIISDVRAQEAVQSFGGWPAFCQRKPEDEHWHRKNFIAAYMKAVPGENIPQILFGESTRRDKAPLMFGDRDLCAVALEYQQSESFKLIDNMTKEFTR